MTSKAGPSSFGVVHIASRKREVTKASRTNHKEPRLHRPSHQHKDNIHRKPHTQEANKGK